MTSQAAIAANRINATKSTGPRTPGGKAAVSRNATRHGLLSRESLIKGESKAELVDFGKRLRTQLAPVGELEFLIVDRVVSTAWRLRRIVSVEKMFFDSANTPDGAFDKYGRDRMAILSRYEVTLERSLYRALHELRGLQSARDGAMVDVSARIASPGLLPKLTSLPHRFCSFQARGGGGHEANKHGDNGRACCGDRRSLRAVRARRQGPDS